MQRVLTVTNMYPTPSNPTSGTFVEQQIKGLRQVGLAVDVLLLERAARGMAVYVATGLKTRARIKKLQPDIVHAMYGGVMADRITRVVTDRPTVVSFCGDDLLGELLSGALRKFISACGVMASYRAARRAAGIVVKSKNLEDALPKWLSRSKVRIIPNGVDLGRFRPLDRRDCRDRLGWNSSSFQVLVPSNHPTKQPELARAAVEVLKRSKRAEFHILGGVPHHEVPIWLNASDVLLLTSKHEGSPNIIKEALACNLPIVSLDVGDVGERIQGVNGCYLAEPDASGLADRLTLVHAGPRRVAGRMRVHDLSVERVALRLKDFYRDVLLSWRTHHPTSSSRLAAKMHWKKDIPLG